MWFCNLKIQRQNNYLSSFDIGEKRSKISWKRRIYLGFKRWIKMIKDLKKMNGQIQKKIQKSKEINNKKEKEKKHSNDLIYSNFNLGNTNG